MVREILVDWTGPGSSPKVSVLYFDTGTLPAGQRAALGTMLAAIDADIVSNYSWTVRTEGRELDTASGVLTGFWGESTAQTGTGARTSNGQVSDSAQALIRWRTSSVIAGRRLQGRTFIPGISKDSLSGGNMTALSRGVLQTAAETFLTNAPSFRIWHRPQGGVGGSAIGVSSVDVWAEFAVLRGRRG